MLSVTEFPNGKQDSWKVHHAVLFSLRRMSHHFSSHHHCCRASIAEGRKFRLNEAVYSKFLFDNEILRLSGTRGTILSKVFFVESF
jgi:hypothetical protein